MKLVHIGAPLLIAAFIVSGCSSGENAAVEPTSTQEEQMAGDDPATWSPVNITMADNGSTLLLVPNQRAIFTDLPADDATNTITLETSDPVVVEVVQREETEDSASVPGLIAVSAGEATITVFDGYPADGDAEVVMTVNITVSE